MIGLLTRLIGGMVTPLVDQVTASSARLLRKVALFVVAALALNAMLIALTMAFELYVASLAGHIVGALAVAAAYLTVAVIAVIFALRGDRPAAVEAGERTTTAPGASEGMAAASGLDDQVDAFAAPLLAMLQRLGLRREQFAVLAGTSLAKQLGPIPLVGLAIVAGFLVGRLGRGWRNLVPTDLISTLLSTDILASLFTGRGGDDGEDDAGDA